MSNEWTRKRMIWTAVVAVLVTAIAALLLMNLSAPEKKLEQTLPHRYSIEDPQFRREMSVMLGPAIIGGNRVVALQNGDEIFPAMLDAIRGAKTSITFETYIYWSGEIGKEFTEALSERARAGIPVNVVIDWAGSVKMDEKLLQRMEQAGVRIHRYRPLRWYSLDRINNRTHRKLLVVDGRIGFTGGVGIADQWLGHAQDPEHWRESHFRIEGPAVAQMQAAFNDNWIKTTGEVLHGHAYFPALSPVGDVDAHLFIASPASGSESMHLMYMMAVSAAKHSIDLAASYFVPDALIVDELIAARERGVRIRVLLPGPHIDSEAVRSASKAGWGPLLQAGIEIHEYQPTMLHTKLLVVDRELVSVGSTNFDIRSFRLNDEASVNLYDRAFADELTRVFESDLERARRYTYETWRQRPLKEKLIEKLVRPLKSQL
ncbi:MAG: phospholipase D-like domain-containing protein [Aromatoleum sp.]|jgi:cardiolipin synthase|uniref:phospholipase D-like domain-containing protein n=1 Tax=Aromatoleum sp. TaxID=2307007 RepID=UPI0028944447|nr:phospholipase D-like domain-containing protein [Aromatoleum sp.]MDT3672178.1 phospholipase D-like domain-containing protein [Aromatoleum sp.]